MNTTALTIRTDAQTKREVTKFADSLGLSVSALVTVLLKQAVREGQIVLSPTPYLQNIIRESEADYAADKHITHTHSKKEALDHLDSLMNK
jgi:addiction module RelB/DinJ family antitoxin